MNVVSIVLDTFRSDIIGPDKKLSFVETPNLDALAAESVVFDNAFGEGQPTLQIRRAFFTGCRSFPFVFNFDRRGHWHHAPGWHKIPPHQDTIAEILTKRGYCTGLISDVYHMFKPTMNYSRGFATYEFIRGQETDNWKGGTPETVAEALKRHTRNPDDIRANSALYQYLLNQRFRRGDEDYQCARVFRAATEWLQDNSANKPFFLWIDAFDPHEPWDPPRYLADKYCPQYEGLDFIMPGALGRNPSSAEVERTRSLYYGEVTFVDQWIGRLLDKMEELALLDDTLILVLSDHGTQVWDHGRFGKGAANLRKYNTGIVWQMRIPGHAAHRRIEANVQSHDVVPTILELLEVSYTRAEGASVMPLVRGEQATHRDPIVIGWADFATGNARAYASVRTPQWNYVTPVHEEGDPWLFDLKADPQEDHNVADQHPDVGAELRGHIEALVGQQLPAKLNEVCDPEPAPMAAYLSSCARHSMPPKAEPTS